MSCLSVAVVPLSAKLVWSGEDMALCFACICVIFHMEASFYKYLRVRTKCT